MKVVSAKQMSELESLAYQQGYREEAFMEQAGKGVASVVHSFIERQKCLPSILMLCGKGNNGGDAFVAGCDLIEKGYKVDAILLNEWDQCTPLCRKNGQRFENSGGHFLHHFPEDTSHYGLMIDGIFGTGFKGAAKEPYATLIQQANRCQLPILSIDIPSGLDGSTGEVNGPVIQATITIYLGLPKLGFFINQGWNYVGELEYVDFGLPVSLIDGFHNDFELSTQKQMSQLLPPMVRNRHKYQAGQVIGLAGSFSMPGAALLASAAALKGGCGMMRLLHPAGMETVLTSSLYEIIKIPYTDEQADSVLNWLQKGKAIFIGPGLGTSAEVKNFLHTIMPQLDVPCVIDADALTLFAEDVFPLPTQTIFTPHTGEMQRLLHQTSKLDLNLDTVHLCQNYVEKHRMTLILKGAPTLIFHPGKSVYINPTGDPGMATAGSGDVLTGLLASLMAQGLNAHQAAILGVYLHGLAGEYAADQYTSYCMIASNLIEKFPVAYRACMSRHCSGKHLKCASKE